MPEMGLLINQLELEPNCGLTVSNCSDAVRYVLGGVFLAHFRTNLAPMGSEEGIERGNSGKTYYFTWGY